MLLEQVQRSERKCSKLRNINHLQFCARTRSRHASLILSFADELMLSLHVLRSGEVYILICTDVFFYHHDGE